MKYSNSFSDILECKNSNDVFNYLINNLKHTITNWNYFVNWTKATNNLEELEIHLNLLNYLIGKENITEAAIKLIRKHPDIIKSIPIIIAERHNKFKLLTEYMHGEFIYKDYDFSKLGKTSPEEAVEFMQKSGFLEQIKSEKIKSLVDYVFGIEVGLDSNARKNRGGKAMENIIEFFIKDICKRNNYEWMSQATAPKIEKEWNKKITVDKSTRRIDFAINSPKKLFLIETNFYNGGGSKLKSTAGEYKSLFDCLNHDGHQFIWITDGAGWKTTTNPLEETFNYIDYILNLSMLQKGILESIIKECT